jgi:LemA protein
MQNNTENKVEEIVKVGSEKAMKSVQDTLNNTKDNFASNPKSYFSTGLFVLLGLFVMSSVFNYNKLVRAENEIEAQWAQVNIALQRRFDAIEQAVGGLKISNKSEQDALQKVTDARKIYVAATGDTEAQVAAANNYGGALNGLLLSRATIGEQYPTLKTPELVGGLIAGVNVEGSENRIAVERQRYNEAVKNFNDKIITFPANLTAKIFGFVKKGYFELVNAEAKNAPKIGEDLKF